ncbi:M28 family metallopeptidase [Novosphingobium sp. KCTC 2891]|uniref:M28 family metallopeptidase n=1 Tax=Novosphingobium sp. KCTC 2891 TaxID=2989730 RepID=UPI002221EF96|nr:M28 family metallopeptidase [Novosphingobium sp. KCTC 2891]MCW1384169.1 M28 family metallopeptidase [Novosphingobium sp. KCTC 2891]
MSRWTWQRLSGRIVLAASAFAMLAAAAPAKRENPIEKALRQHVETLASDDFDGREPGTEGESKTLRYLARQWFDIGMESGTNDPAHGWFAPVEVVEREPLSFRASFTRGRRKIVVPDDAGLVVTSGIRSLVENAPVVFVGYGDAPAVPRIELAGRIALMLDSRRPGSAPDREGGDRAGRLLDAGAAAVVTVLDGDQTIDDVTAHRRRAGYALSGDRLGGDIEAYVSSAVANAMLAGGTVADVSALRREAAAVDFAPRLMGLSGTLEATSRETRIRTHNLIGKLEGRNPGSGAVMLVAHWDHFGKCASPPAEDLICNGAVDNASGLAVITEAARILSRGRQLDRDVYFLATTGEELGLLGALAFAESPPLPLDRIVAVFNVDSTGLAPAGQPFSVVGKGTTDLDAGIVQVVRAMKRKLAPGDAANAFIKRQDGWVFRQHDVPAVMVSTSYSNQERLEKFMEDTYHRPSDEAAKVEYGGMVDDVQMQVELVRYFGDARRFPGRTNAGSRTP